MTGVRALCEPMFVSIKGSSYVNFRRALASGNLLLIRSAAAELPSVNLKDALAICAAFAAEEPGRYERAALRWIARFALELPEVTLADIHDAAEALALLPHEPDRALRVLRELVG